MKKVFASISIIVVITVLLLCFCNLYRSASCNQKSEVIDIELQQYAEELIAGKLGALVAVSPATGKVICQVSTAWHQLEFFNCNISNHKASGSVFNTAYVLACLQDSIITSETELQCNHGFWKDGCRIIGCHDGAVIRSLADAMATSCNGYFGGCLDRFINSKKFNNSNIAIARLYDLIKSLGLGRDMEFGAEEFIVTPYEMANLAAIIANRGYDHKVGTKVPIDSVHFESVINGMSKSVDVGTVWRAGNMNMEGIDLCGITGTTLIPQRFAFMGFAPKDNPEIAIYCVVEDESGIFTSVSIATLVIEKYLNRHISNRRKWMER